MTDTPTDRIRNFSIIAHIDHGKSTLADRLIQATGGLTAREMTEQVLDTMDLEKERGITIKAQTVRLTYQAKDGETYELNLMDTPGHVDFAYEVSRSLAACEGSLLVVDASQGVEAQTLANVYQAIDAHHEIVPILNKIDLPAAEPERVKQQIEDVIGLDASDAVVISAKTGLNIEGVLEALVTRLPPPKGDANAPLKALLVDSWYDQYLGVVILVRVKDGRLKRGQRIRMMSTGAVHPVEQVGVFTPKMRAVDDLGPGEIGYITAAIKTVADCKVGDTITDDRTPAAEPLPGFKPSIPVVWCGLYPVDADDFEKLRDSLGKLRLNDASFHYEPETSAALGFGFRCGFLGLLHLEIIQERLTPRIRPRPDRHRPIAWSTTSTSTNGEMRNCTTRPTCRTARHRPHRGTLDQGHHHGAGRIPRRVLTLCNERRGQQADLTYVGNRAMAVYRLPLNEVVFDFYDRLKSVSRGYASFDYQMDGYAESDLVKISILVNQDPVDALSFIAHRSGGGKARPLDLRAAEGPDPQAVVQDRHPGGHRRPGHRPRNHRRAVQGRHGEMLRRRHLAQTQAAGEAERRQEADAPVRQGGNPAVSAFLAALKMDA